MPLRGDAVNQVEVLGATVWLWLHSDRHRPLALQQLNRMLLPVIKRGQYVLAYEGMKPVFFASWACFDAAAEQRYLADPDRLFDAADWDSGDRFWAIDWVAPFGHSHRLRYLLDEDLLSRTCSRILCRNAGGARTRVLQHHGRRVSRDQAYGYFQARPISEYALDTGRAAHPGQ
ncbi:MAG: toxin-activating lysine-acyltransferase [Sedimenticola sp.]|nr:toxin-activating lysine-acyltransferase [Sedimenticola sp.]